MVLVKNIRKTSKTIGYCLVNQWRWYLVIAVLATTFLFSQKVSAAIAPPYITYQGRLFVGSAPATTTKNIIFTLYDAASGGSALYTAAGTLGAPSTVPIVPVNGLFTIYLGDTGTNAMDPAIFQNNGSVYLEVTVNGETLSPRKRIISSPFAFNAKYLDGVAATSTPTSSKYIPISDDVGNFNFNRITSTGIFASNGIQLDNGTLNVNKPMPQIVGYVSSSNFLDAASSVAISGKYAYVTSFASSSLAVLDISQPTNPTIVGFVASTTLLNGAFGINVAGKYAYISSRSSNSLTIIDVSNPTNPRIVGSTSHATKLSGARAIYVVGKYAYVVAQFGANLAIVDISNPSAPTTTSFTTLVGAASPQGIYVNGKYAYVVSGGSDAISIIDISDPTAPTTTGRLIDNNLLNGANGIYVSGKYAYVGNSIYSGITIVDVSSTTAPAIVGTTSSTLLNGGATLFVSGKYAYVGALFNDSLTVVDISNPTAPTTTAYLNDPRLVGIWEVKVVGKYAYAPIFNSDAFAIIDLNGADISTAEIGNISTNVLTVWENADIGNNLYVGNGISVGRNGLYSAGAITISSSTSSTLPLLTINGGSFQILDGITNSVFTTNSLYLGKINSSSNGNFFVNNGSISASGSLSVFSTSSFRSALAIGTTTPSEKLHVFDGTLLIDNPVNPKIIGYTTHATFIGSPQDVYVSGKYAYVVTFNGRLTILDISDPRNPTTTASISDSTKMPLPTKIVVSGKYAYVANLNDIVTVVDISNPSAPTTTSFVSPSSTFLGINAIAISGKYLYTGHGNANAFSIIDISNPLAPTTTAHIIDASRLSNIYGIQIVGNYAYVASWGNNGISIIDISNPSKPAVVGFVSNATSLRQPLDIYVDGRYAYVAGNQRNYITIVDVSRPSNPTIVSIASSSAYTNGGGSIKIVGKYAFAAAQTNNSIAVFDISSSTAPTTTGFVTDATRLNQVNSIYVAGKYIYAVSGAANSFTVIDILGADIHAANIGNLATNQLTVWQDVDVGSGLKVRNSINVGVGGIFSQGAVTIASTTSSTLPLLTVLGGSSFLNITSTNAFTNGLSFVTASGTSITTTNAYISNLMVGNCIGCGSGGGGGAVNTSTAFYFAYYLNNTSVTGTPLMMMSGNTIAISGGLNVTGDASFVTTTITTSTIASLNFGNANGGALNLINATSTNFYVSEQFISATTSSFFGNVAIGTSTPSSKLQVFGGTLTVDNPNPEIVGTATGLTDAVSVHVFGKYAYVVGSASNTLYIVDISVPTNPVKVGEINNLGTIASVFVSGKYAYTANNSSSTLSIIDVSNPTTPTLVGMTTNTLVGAFKVFVSGKYAYVVRGSNSTMSIVNVSDPANPTVESTISGLIAPREVYVVGKYAYVVRGTNNRLSIIDVSDPKAPFITGTVAGIGNPYSVYVSGRYAYTANFGSSSMSVVDISDATNPVIVGSVAGLGTPYSIQVAGKYAYTANFGSSSMSVVDISDPTAPFVVNNMFGLGGPWSLKISGKYAYVANRTSSTLSVIDLKGADISTARIGSISTNNLTVWESGQIGNTLYVGNGINVGQGGIYSLGSITIASSTSSTLPLLTVLGGSSLQNVSSTNLSVSNELNFSNAIGGSVTTTNIYNGLQFVSAGTSSFLGNVAIGTSTPSGRLHVYNGTLLVDSPSVSIAGTLGDMGGAWSTFVREKYVYVANFASNSVSVVDISDPAVPSLIGQVGNLGGVRSVQVSGKFAYTADYASNTMSVIDVSNPAAPDKVGSVSGLDTPIAVSIYGKYAYIANYTGGTVSIADISNPYSPTLVASIGGLNLPRSLYISGKYLYITNSGGTTMSVVDVSDPLDPTLVGVVTGLDGPISVQVVGPYAYITNNNANTLSVVDVSDPTAAYVAATATGLNSPWAVGVAGKYAYVTNVFNQSVSVIDISNPLNPTLINSVTGFSAPRSISISGKYAYIANSGNNTLNVVDLKGADISTANIGNVSTDYLLVTQNGEVANNLTVGNSVRVGASGIYTDGGFTSAGTSSFALRPSSTVGIGTNSPKAKLHLFDGELLVDNPKNMHLVGFVTDTVRMNRTPGIDISGKYAYVISNNLNSLAVVDVSNPSVPFVTGFVSDTEHFTGANGVVVSGQYAYVAGGSGLAVVDISNPSAPTTTGFVSSTLMQGAFDVFVSGKYAYVGGFSSLGIIAVDISNPRNPVIVGSLLNGTIGNVSSVFVSGKYAYLTGRTQNRLSIVDISNPHNMVLVGTTTHATYLNGANRSYVSGRYAYVISRLNEGLTIVDVSDPTNPTTTGFVTSPSMRVPYGISVSGKYAYVGSNASSSITAIDISSSTNPIVVASTPAATSTSPLGEIYNMKVVGKYAYTASRGPSGIAIVDLLGADISTAQIGSITTNRITVLDAMTVGSELYVGSGLSVGFNGIQTAGGLGVAGSSTLATTTISQLYVNNISVSGVASFSTTTFTSSTINNLNFGSATGTNLNIAGLFLFTNASGTSITSTNIFGSNINANTLTSTYVYTPGLSFVNGSGTSLTSTNLFVSFGRFNSLTSTNLFANGGSFGLVNINELQVDNASTTNLAVMGITRTSGTTTLATGNGFVGIGTLNPTRMLEIVNTQSVPFEPGTSTIAILLRNTASGALPSRQSDIIFAGSDASPTGNYAAITGVVTGSGLAGQVGDLVFSTKSLITDATLSERLRIDYLGNVGIGTSTPAAMLHVNGTFLVNGTSTLATTSISSLTAGAITSTNIFNSNNFVVLGTSTLSTTTISNLSVGTSTVSSSIARIFDTTLLVDGPATPKIVGFVSSSVYLNSSQKVHVSGNYAYVVSGGSNTLAIIDVSNPLAPTTTGYTESSLLNGTTKSLKVVGKYAYVVSSVATSLSIIDVSNPSAPTTTGSLVDAVRLSVPSNIYISGKYAYITVNGTNDALVVVDISNPATPKIVGSVVNSVTLNGAAAVYVSGNYAYVAAGSYDGLTIVDISNPQQPFITGSVSDSFYFDSVSEVYVSGRYAYTAAGGTGARTVASVDISNPSNPIVRDDYTNSSIFFTSLSMAVAGDYAYVTTPGSDRLTVVDISNPLSLKFVGTITDAIYLDGATDIAISGKYAYVTVPGQNGLSVVDLKGADISSANIGAVQTGNLIVTENADIGNDLFVKRGLSVGPGGIFSQGPVSIVSSSSSTLPLLSLFGGGIQIQDSFATSSLTTSTLIIGGTSSNLQGSFYVNSYGTSVSGTLQIFGTSTFKNILPEQTLTYDLGASTSRWNSLWASTLNIGTSTWSVTQDIDRNFAIFDGPNATGNKWLSISSTGTISMLGSTNFNSSSINSLTVTGTTTLATTSIQSIVGNYNNGDLLYATSSRLTSLAIGNFNQFLTVGADGSPTWSSVSLNGATNYFFYFANSDTTTMFRQLLAPTSTRVISSFGGIGTGSTTLKSWITNAGTPNISFIPAGTYSVMVHGARTGGSKNVQLYADILETTATGTDIAIIGTTELTPNLTGVENEYILDFINVNVYNFASTSSRIKTRIYAIGAAGGTNATVEIYQGGTSDSHTALPSTSVDATNFVPYLGASQNLNLAGNSLLAKQLFISGTSTLGTTTIGRTGLITDETLDVLGSFAVESAPSVDLFLVNSNGLFVTVTSTLATTTISSSTISRLNFNNATGTSLNISSLLLFNNATGTSLTSTNLFASRLNYLNATGTSLSSTNIYVANRLTSTGTASFMGNVGIGTSTPAAKLHLYNSLLLIDTPNPSFVASVDNLTGAQDIIVSGKYTYVFRQDGVLSILDTTNPTSPTRVSTTTIALSTFNPVLQGNFVYVGNGIDTFHIVDVTDVSHPTTTGSLSISPAAPYGIAVNGKYAYVGEMISGKLDVIDISNHREPRLINQVSGFSSIAKIKIIGKYLFAADQGFGLRIFDISNPINPVQISTLAGVGAITNLEISGKYLYTADYNFGSHLYVVDISDVSSPRIINSIVGFDSPTSLYLAGKYLYLTDTENDYLRVVDISRPENPVLISTTTGFTNLNSVAVSGRFAYTTDMGAGSVKVFEIKGAEISSANIGNLTTNEINVSENADVGAMNIRLGLNVGMGGIKSYGGLVVTNYNTSTAPAMSVVGGASFVGTTTMNFVSINTSSVNSLNFISSTGTNLNLSGLFNYSSASGTSITSTNSSVSSLLKLNYIASCNAANQALQTGADGSVSCGTITAGGGGSSGVGTSTPNFFAFYNGTNSVTGTEFMFVSQNTISFTTTTTFTTSTFQSSTIQSLNFASATGTFLDVFGTTTLAVSPSSSVGIGTSTPKEKLHVVDGTLLVDSPVNPVIVGSAPGFLFGTNVYVSGKYAYVSDINTGNLSIMDVSDPTQPVRISTSTGLFARGVQVKGKYAYVASYNLNALSILDVSNPGKPKLVGSVNGISQAFGVAVSGKYAYVLSNQVSGYMAIVDISNPTAPFITATIFANLPNSIYVNGKFAYITNGGSNNLSIIDVSSPYAPVQEGNISPGGIPQSVYVSGKYAYVVSQTTDSLYVVNVSSSTSPVVVGSVNGMSIPRSVFVSGKYAYVGSAGSGVIYVVDISSSTKPLVVGGVSGAQPYGLYVAGKHLYSAGSVFNVIDIKGADISAANVGNIATNDLTVWENVDIGNDLSIRNSLMVGGGGILSSGPISISSSTLTTSSLFSVFGTSTVQNVMPRLNLTYDLGASSTRWNSLWAATVNVGTSTWSISQDVNKNFSIFDRPNGQGNKWFSINTDGTINLSGTTTLATTTIANLVVNNCVGCGAGSAGTTTWNYIGDSVFLLTSTSKIGIGTTTPKEKVHIYDSNLLIDGPVNLASVGTTTDSVKLKEALSIYVSGRYAYIGSDYGNSMAVVDISNPKAPTTTGFVSSTLLSNPKAIHVAGNYAYVAADERNGLAIVDVSNSSKPVVVGFTSSTALSNGEGIFVSGNYAYVTSLDKNGLAIVDISNPKAPTTTGFTSSTEMKLASGVYVVGKYAYVTGDGAVSVLDVSNPRAPTTTGKYLNGSLLTESAGIYLSGKYAYVASYGNYSLLVIDVSSSTAPVGVGYVQDGTALGFAYSVFVSGKYAYVAGFNGLASVDISDPENPQVAGYLPYSDTWGVFVSGKYAYLTAATDNSLYVIDIKGADIHAANIGNLTTNALTVYENADLGMLSVRSSVNVGSGGIYTSGEMSVYSTTTLFGNVLIGTTTYFANAKLAIDAGTSTAYGLAINGFARASGGFFASSSLDLAERYPIDPACEAAGNCPTAGDVVCQVENTTTIIIEKCSVPYSSLAIGIVSTDPGFVLEGGFTENNSRKIALAGRVPIRVSTANGAIKPGDLLAPSGVPGIAIKATNDGTTVGKALESYTDTGVNGFITAYVQLGWNHSLIVATNSTTTNSTSSGFLSSVVNVFKEIGIFIEQGIIRATEFIADKMTTKELCIGSTCVNEIQLQQLLLNNNIQPQVNNNPPTETTPPPTETTPPPTETTPVVDSGSSAP